MKKIRLVTLFSGYDSQAMALERIKQVVPDFDYELVRWCEIDKNAIKAHDLCFPEYKGRNLGDITKVDWGKVKAEIGDIDLLTFSSPCQDFSAAGLMRGGERGSGTRSSLIWEVEKAIVALNPKYLMLENVKNLVSKKFKPLFFRWLRLLEDYGYKSYWKVLNAKDYGVPQNRERVFCISIRKDVSDAPYIFPEPFELKTKLKDVLEDQVDDKYYLSEKSIEGFLNHNEKEWNK